MATYVYCDILRRSVTEKILLLLVPALSFPVCFISIQLVLWLLDLQAEVNVLHRLVHRARAKDVDLCLIPSAYITTLALTLENTHR